MTFYRENNLQTEAFSCVLDQNVMARSYAFLLSYKAHRIRNCYSRSLRSID